ncbi:MAG TPA: CCA tRNA nucleotidyltransferase, partial [Terriglobales bacterium]
MKLYAIHIVSELRKHGFEAYFAGGCVRDTLLGLDPTDYDITTNAVPNEVMRIFP